MSYESRDKIEKYLEGVEEATNLFEALDFPPTRIRAILLRAFNDYYDKRIDEDILIGVGSILHNLQMGTWDYDPGIMSVTCMLDDQIYGGFGVSSKKEREKMYGDCYKQISENKTISVSLPNELVKKLEKISKGGLLIHDLVKKIILKHCGKLGK